MKHKSAFVGLYPWCIMTSELLQALREYIMGYIMALRVCRDLEEERDLPICSMSRVGTCRLWRRVSSMGKCRDLSDIGAPSWPHVADLKY